MKDPYLDRLSKLMYQPKDDKRSTEEVLRYMDELIQVMEQSGIRRLAS
jgi:hypothetical protein